LSLDVDRDILDEEDRVDNLAVQNTPVRVFNIKKEFGGVKAI